MGLIDSVWTQYLKIAKSEISHFNANPFNVQWTQLEEIINTAKKTEYGRKYNFSSIRSIDDFQNIVPLLEYDDIKTYIHRMMKGEESILWPGKITHFAKSSGTTSDKSKYIPITSENHKHCHTRGGLRLTASIYDQVSYPGILDGKAIILTGSIRNNYPEYPNAVIGDVSAVIYSRLSYVLKTFLTPDEQSNLLEDSESKLDVIAHKCIHEDVRMMAGSPTWMMILCKKLLQITGKKNILEIWPKFKILVHGAVSFVPYRKSFEELFPGDQVYFFEDRKSVV